MTTDRGIRLRPVDAGDIGTLFEQQRDTEANRMAAFGAPDPDDRRAFDRRWERILADPEAIARVIEVDGQVAGSVSIWRDPDMEGPEVTYWIGREFWGQGVATEALRQYLAVVPTRPLYGRVASTNPGSLRVLEKCGFRLVRTERNVQSTVGSVDEHVLRLGSARSIPGAASITLTMAR